MTMMHRRNADVLLELVALNGATVIDVGSGDGALTRLMTRQGARVLGIETSDYQLAKARAAERQGDEVYAEGTAEHLPAPDCTIDAVVFFNSLHHVEVDAMDQALAEAARVLRPGGFVYVSEPIAEGPFFELCRPVDDETVVRARALEAIRAAGRFGLIAERELTYLHTIIHPDYDSFRERILSANQEREPILARLDADLRAAFQRLATPTATMGHAFDQPTRVNLLRKG